MMNDAIEQIGQRLKGLRDVLDIPAEEVADLCGINTETYLKMEEGEGELSISNLQKISKQYGIALDVLLFGEEPHNRLYFLTRKGQGMSVERRKEYAYQSLASGFRARKADPFMVTEGCLELTIGKKVLVLNEGDSIYFDATQPHCMRALNGQPVKFLAIIF